MFSFCITAAARCTWFVSDQYCKAAEALAALLTLTCFGQWHCVCSLQAFIHVAEQRRMASTWPSSVMIHHLYLQAVQCLWVTIQSAPTCWSVLCSSITCGYAGTLLVSSEGTFLPATHVGVCCRDCLACPILGKCHRHKLESNVHLCDQCLRNYYFNPKEVQAYQEVLLSTSQSKWDQMSRRQWAINGGDDIIWFYSHDNCLWHSLSHTWLTSTLLFLTLTVVLLSLYIFHNMIRVLKNVVHSVWLLLNCTFLSFSKTGSLQHGYLVT